jgi:hypothetical protein
VAFIFLVPFVINLAIFVGEPEETAMSGELGAIHTDCTEKTRKNKKKTKELFNASIELSQISQSTSDTSREVIPDVFIEIYGCVGVT